MPSEKELKDFIESETKRMDKERAEYMKEHDMEEFYQFPVGATEFELLAKIPRNYKGNFGPRKAFRIMVSGVEWDWSVNPNSPIYRDLINYLTESPCQLQLVRTGTGQQTRYTLLESGKVEKST